MQKIGTALILFLAVEMSTVYAQNGSVTFPSSQLQEMALRYTGDTLNWPILVQITERNIQENSFTLSQSALLQLETLSEATAIVIREKERMKELIANGATVFAKDEWIAAVQQFEQHKQAVADGDLDEAITSAFPITEKLNILESVLASNRMVEIQAELEDKVGRVDKRVGILGDWDSAEIGDLFEESDGLKTHAESFANLGFTDGSKIIVDPNTVAIIRKSRVDKLDERAEAEITLESGGLLARLSSVATQRSNYVLNAGSSETELRTTNFYAESDGNETVKLTNYDGVASVSANDVTITIRENEGTIVREGEAPAPPIQLLPAPELFWDSQDTVVYKDQIIYTFNQVQDAESYIVQRSTSSSFDKDLQEIEVSNNVALLSYLPLGRTYVRVAAIDRLGLRGPFSETTRIIRNEDNQPPPAFIDNLNGNVLFTLTNSATITGVTQPDARVLVNSVSVPVQNSGRFTYTLENLVPDQSVSIVAMDDSGNNTVRGVRVVQLTEDILFNLALNGARGRDVIVVDRPSVTISSRAYPGLEVIINNAGTTRRVQTDSQGRWGITMNMQQGELSVTFKDIRTGELYLTKSFTVQAN